MALVNVAFHLVVFMTVAKSNPVEVPPIITVPEECMDKQLCDVEPENYPQSYFDEFVDSLNDKDFMLTGQYVSDILEITNVDEDNCGTRESIVKPFVLRSNMTSKLVVQTKYYQQRVKQTECLNIDQTCFDAILKPGYVSKCTTTYGTLKLYVYNTETQNYEYETVEIPVCCSCSLKSTI